MKDVCGDQLSRVEGGEGPCTCRSFEICLVTEWGLASLRGNSGVQGCGEEGELRVKLLTWKSVQSGGDIVRLLGTQLREKANLGETPAEAVGSQGPQPGGPTRSRKAEPAEEAGRRGHRPGRLGPRLAGGPSATPTGQLSRAAGAHMSGGEVCMRQGRGARAGHLGADALLRRLGCDKRKG